MSAAPARTRLTGRDARFLALCLAAVVAFGAVAALGFTRAFPEASIDFKLTREEARDLGAKELTRRGFDLAGTKALVEFDVDDEAKVFLERTLGLEKANPLYGSTVPVWRWSLRFVRPEQKLEYRAAVTPTGQVIAFRRLLPEADAAPDPGEEKARALAEETLRSMRGLDPSALRFVEVTAEKRPHRTDRTFVWESRSIRFGDAALRYLVEVQGDRVGRSSQFLEVPEAWKKDYAHLRSKNEAAGLVATFGMLLTCLALVAVCVERLLRHDVKWRVALTFGGLGGVLQLATKLNELPLRLVDYDTNEAWSTFLAKSLALDIAGAIAIAVFIVLLVAAGEPLFRERFGDKLALSRMFTARALRSRRFLRGVALGYALVAFFFAYQVVFYIAAEKLGAWAPADVPYSNLLGTSFPWIAVLLAGFIPAVTEEFLSRMFSIPFAMRFLPRWAAVVVPALIWGFAHSAYPNQPFFIRGVEVGMAGIVIGTVMLKEGLLPLLVWHFTVDAVYTSLILVRSSNPYFAISGLAAALILLLPLVAAVVLYVKDGGFLPDEELTNAAAGSAPPPPSAPIAEPPALAAARGPSRRLAPLLVIVALAAAALFKYVLPHARWGPNAVPAVSRTVATRFADTYFRAQGDDPSAYFSSASLEAALPALEDANDSGADLVPYHWSSAAERWLLTHGGFPALVLWETRILPGPVWQVRYVRPLDHHGAWIVVDARSGAVVAMKRFFPEDEPGAAPDDAAARTLGGAALRSFRVDPSGLTVVSTQTQERKSRRDHRIVYESGERAGEAPRRFVVELAGDRTALVATALKLPEAWVRDFERTKPIGYASSAWFLAGASLLSALVLVELLRRLRRETIPWRRLAGASALLALPSLVREVASVSQLVQILPVDAPLTVWTVSGIVAVCIRVLFAFAIAFFALLLVHLARPGALLEIRFPADGRRAAIAGVAAALVLVAMRSFRGGLFAAFPLAARFSTLPFPPVADSPFPIADLLDTAIRFLLLIGAAAASAVLLFRGVVRPLPARVFVCAAILGLCGRWSVSSGGELAIALLGGLLVAAALAALCVVLLRDDPASYVAFAAVLLAVRGGELLKTDITAWQVHGGLALAAALAVVLWLVAAGSGRRALAGR